jgi:Histidine kinase-, DNA gyrase B-, and HSP90-like ATPase
MIENNDLRVEAGAEKRFFIDMLVKDIELLPALVDLVDNSIDSARSVCQGGDLHGFRIDVVATSELCRVEDNAAGIELSIARNYAFRFGRPAGFTGTKRSVGQFGIGMKRSLFKIGRSFLVSSTFAPTSGRPGTQFMLEVDVEQWSKEPDWAFTLTDANADYELGPTESAGTTIEIRDLHPSVRDDFASKLVLARLANELSVRHQQSIKMGLDLRLNGQTIKAAPPALQSSELIRPIRREFKIETPEGDVQALVLAGTARAKIRPDVDDGDADSFRESSDAGWYLFCNDRLLISADRTELTGWGDPAAAYHPQYRFFRGYAYLTADDAALLPWNTTKTAADRDSAVFRRIQSEMKTALVEVQAVLNRYKADRQYAKDDPDRAPTALDSAISLAPEVPVEEIAPSPKLAVPPAPPRPTGQPRNQDQRITYLVPRSIYQDVHADLGASTAAEVGRQTFEYYVDNELRP